MQPVAQLSSLRPRTRKNSQRYKSVSLKMFEHDRRGVPGAIRVASESRNGPDLLVAQPQVQRVRQIIGPRVQDQEGSSGLKCCFFGSKHQHRANATPPGRACDEQSLHFDAM